MIQFCEKLLNKGEYLCWSNIKNCPYTSMEKYKYKRRIRKIKKFGKKLGIVAIFLVVSYLLSLFSFYLYTQLSQILLPETKGVFGFAAIGLIAGFVSILVSFINNRFILTVVISFFIYCLVDSVLLFSKLGIQVIQFLPGLLVSMSAVIAPWYFLKRKLGLFMKKGKVLDDTKEHVYKEYALARKLIENPNKLTLETFKEACGLLEGIDPKIDAVLKKADYVSRTLTFLNGKDVIGFAVANIKVKTKEDEEKKEKLLFFIDLVHDIWEEVNVAFVRLDAARGVDNIGHQGTATIAASGPSSIASVTMTIVAATTVIAAGTVGIIPGSSFLPKNESQIPKTQNSQEVNTPGVTSIIVPSTTPTARPTAAPTLAITVDNGWGHFTRIFSGPPGEPGTTSTLDLTSIAVYATIHNTGTESDRLTGATSQFCKNFTMQDMSPESSDPGQFSISISIPAQSTLELKFMGQRLICEGASGVKQGDRIPVGLIFEKFGQVPVLVEIRSTPN